MSDQVDRIRDVVFTSVKLGEAYDMDQIDYLLDLLLAAAERGEPLAPVLDGVELNQVRLREGYSIEEVDAFFAEIVRPAPESAPEPAPGPSPAPVKPEPVAPTVIVAQRGILARLFRRG
jgi:hypothetical protein